MKSSSLKDLTDRLGMTQDDLASLSGRSTRSVRSWLSGAFQPPPSVILILIAIDEGRIDFSWLAVKLTESGK